MKRMGQWHSWIISDASVEIDLAPLKQTCHATFTVLLFLCTASLRERPPTYAMRLTACGSTKHGDVDPEIHLKIQVLDGLPKMACHAWRVFRMLPTVVRSLNLNLCSDYEPSTFQGSHAVLLATSIYLCDVFRNMCTQLVKYERLETKLSIAKALQSRADRLVTYGKRGGLHLFFKPTCVVLCKNVELSTFATSSSWALSKWNFLGPYPSLNGTPEVVLDK